MNSAVSLLRLWNMCVRSQGDGVDNVVQWGTLRITLEGIGCRARNLSCNSVDDILRRHFGTSGINRDHVTFTQYWYGMEEILQACGAFHNGGVDTDTEHKVCSLRSFRDAVLGDLQAAEIRRESHSALLADGEEEEFDDAGGALLVIDLRRHFERLRWGARPAVAAYWEERLQGLPGDEESVTGDEIASALLAWLEELLKEAMEGLDESGSPGFGDMGYGEEAGSSSGDEPASLAGPPGATAAALARARGGGLGALGRSLPPPPGRRWRPPMARDDASAARGAQPSSWLTGAGPEDERFRDFLLARVGEADTMTSFMELYRVVRDAVEDEEDAAATTDSSLAASPPPRTPPQRRVPASGAAAVPFIRAGAGRLADVVSRRLREPFRALEDEVFLAEGFAEEGQPPNDIIVNLICSQARSAETLERRAARVPWAYRLASVLARVRNQRCKEAIAQWRGTPSRFSLASTATPSPAGSPLASFASTAAGASSAPIQRGGYVSPDVVSPPLARNLEERPPGRSSNDFNGGAGAFGAAFGGAAMGSRFAPVHTAQAARSVSSGDGGGGALSPSLLSLRGAGAADLSPGAQSAASLIPTSVAAKGRRWNSARSPTSPAIIGSGSGGGANTSLEPGTRRAPSHG